MQVISEWYCQVRMKTDGVNKRYGVVTSQTSAVSVGLRWPIPCLRLKSKRFRILKIKMEFLAAHVTQLNYNSIRVNTIFEYSIYTIVVHYLYNLRS